MFRKIAAVVKKDLLMETSYRFSFVFNICGVLASLLTYFFIDRLFGARMVPHLEEFGVGYFPYVLVSIAFFGYVGVGLGSFAERIHAEQMQGTLEALLMTPTRITTILLSLAVWNLIIATVDLVIYAVLGAAVFGIDFGRANILSTAVIFVLTILSFSGLGILSAAFIMVFKRGNPVDWIVSSVEGLISGVFFPVTVLPAWLQFVAQFFPITYAIRAIQLAVYKGYTVGQLSGEIGALAFFSALLLPLGLAAFTHGLRKARRDGTLGQY